MASSEDFQSIYELYKKQGIPKGISIVNFCRQNGIVYSQLMEMPMYSCLKTVKRLRLYDSKNHKRFLYDITYEKGYKFLQPVFEGNTVIYGLDFKYLAALLECPVVKIIGI